MLDLTSFNPMKILLWGNYLNIIAKGGFPPPIAVHVDLTQDCNFHCPHCMTKHLREKRSLGTMHLLRLAAFLKDFGVKAVYVTATGESMLHPAWVSFVRRLNHNGIEVGVVTNGSLMDSLKRDTLIECCRFVGISLDAASAATFSKVHGVGEEVFASVISNIKLLVAERRLAEKRLQVVIKYLILPENRQEVWDAAKLAKDLGADGIHIRPAFPTRLETIGAIQWWIARAKELENKTFFVRAVRVDLLDKPYCNSFEQCRPFGAIFAADGFVYPCCLMIRQPSAIIGQHFPDLSQARLDWGSDRHKKVLVEIDPKQCQRCPYGSYNEIVEKVIERDGMFKNFL